MTDTPPTTREPLAEMGLDGGKMLIRIALEDPGTVRTLEHTACAVSELAGQG